MSDMALSPKLEVKSPRPYKKPVLQHLGSVRELTLAALTVTGQDAGTGFRMGP